jgi:flagellin-like protein
MLWRFVRIKSAARLYMMMTVERILPATGTEDKNMQNENRNDEAVSPVIATILMVAITVVLAGVLYVWAASLAEGNTDGNLALYAFGGEDATGSVTDGTGDDLVRITMSQGGDLNWASVSVKISVDNGAPVTCSNGDASGSCDLVEFGNTGDQFWSVGDGVTIVESGQDLCTTGTCVIKVTITDTREGKTLDETTAVAE